MNKPIRPQDVTAGKLAVLPDAVLRVFNDLITAAWDGREATVRQGDAVDRIANALGIERHDVFARHLLDVEDIYRQAGWIVEYDKPGYNEGGEAVFRFRAAPAPERR